MTEPKPPDNFDELSQDEQVWEKKLLHHRLVHYHYILSTAMYNDQAAVGADRDGGWLGAFFQGRYAMFSRDHPVSWVRN